jgi:predicted Rossmann fold flavoprotein
MIGKYPRGKNLVKKSFHQFFTSNTIHWFEERGVHLKTETDGRMFPTTDSSQTIIDCIIKAANSNNVQIRMNAEVKNIERTSNQFTILLSDHRTLTADFICVASGGYPKLSMFEWLRTLGHSIIEPAPSLFTFNIPGNRITELMGISVEQATVKITGSKLEETGQLLITHWGLSGPVVLKLSAWGAVELQTRNYNFNILVNWLPKYNENSLRTEIQQLRFNIASQKMVNRNPFHLPQRLWEYLLTDSGIKEDVRWADLPSKEQNKLIKNLCAAEFAVKGKTTFKEEFVTAGGIDLNEIDSNTMMSKVVPNMFFAGEVMNIDGVTGGFNFQNAWTTGWIAAKTVSTISRS